jgi:hypothetical protein
MSNFNNIPSFLGYLTHGDSLKFIRRHCYKYNIQAFIIPIITSGFVFGPVVEKSFRLGPSMLN